MKQEAKLSTGLERTWEEQTRAVVDSSIERIADDRWLDVRAQSDWTGAHRSSTTCVITTHLPHLQELNFYPPRTLTCLKTMVHEVLLVIFYEHRKSVQSLCELKKCLMRPSNVTIDRSAMNRQPVSHRSLAFQSMINNAWQITERKTRIWKRDCYRSSCKWSVGSYRLSEGAWTTVHCDTHRHLPAFRTQQQ